jgi:hypothetical protein
VPSFRLRRQKTLHLLGNLETGKSKKEFCASLRFRSEKSCAGTKSDRIGQFGTAADRFGQSGTTRDKLGQCESMPLNASKGHKKQQKATESHNWKQLETTGDNKATRVEMARRVLEHKGLGTASRRFSTLTSYASLACPGTRLKACGTAMVPPRKDAVCD